MPVKTLAWLMSTLAASALAFPTFAGAEPKAKPEKNLVGAVYANNVKQVRELLKDKGVVASQLDPQCPPNTRCKPISFAADNGSVEITKLLLDAGADINGRSAGSGDTPLILATMNKHVALVRFLLDRGADPNVQNRFGATAFWGACAMGEEESVKAMLTHGANVNYSGQFPDSIDGKRKVVTDITPAMIAAKMGHRGIVASLAQAGADLRRRDSEGRTAADYAKLGGNTELQHFIEGKVGGS